MKSARNNETESEMLRELSLGSVEAFDWLYQRYYEPVRANIFKIVRDEEATDDLLQDLFVSVWERREKFAAYGRISGWLFVSSYNRSINYLRNRATEALHRDSLRRVSVHTEDEVEWQRQEEQLRLIEAAIEQLPPQRKRVFELCRFQGLTYEQAAQELSISKNTVKDHLARASETIIDYLKSHPEGRQLLAQFIFFSILASTNHPFSAAPCF